MKPNIQKLAEYVEQKTRRNITFASEYAERGYTQPEAGILFGNWNPTCGFSVPKAEQRRDPISKFARIAEHCGFELEWEDEWSTCGECGKAVRTSPDCYHWTPYFRILNECELVCLDCLDPESYLESIEDNAACAVPDDNRFRPELFGYVQHNGYFETGFHPGQNDNPATILKALHAQGHKHVVFRIASKSQFDIRWEAYYKPTDEIL